MIYESETPSWIQTINPTFGTCFVVDDCLEQRHYRCIDSFCQHKQVFPSLYLEWLGVFCYMIIMALCNIGGIGGGGIA